MDEAAQALAYAEADFSAPHSAFVEEFARRFPGEPVEGLVIDLGCGPADVTVRFARAHPHCALLGVDGAQAMLAHARRRVRAEALEGRIGLVHGYLPECLPALERARTLISNSLLHHLREAATLWQAVATLGLPGARVLVMDLLRPDSPAQAEALVRTYAAGEPEVLRRDFHRSLLAAYRVEEVRAQVGQAGLGGLAVEAVSDRHLLVWGRIP